MQFHRVQKSSDEERVVMEKLESSISYNSDQHKYTVEIPYPESFLQKDNGKENDTLKKSIVSVFETLKSEAWVERVSTCDIYLHRESNA